MAHKKGQSSSRNGRDSQPKMLGIKAYGGEFVTTGTIIVRQRGDEAHLFAQAGEGESHVGLRAAETRVESGRLAEPLFPGRGEAQHQFAQRHYAFAAVFDRIPCARSICFF